MVRSKDVRGLFKLRRVSMHQPSRATCMTWPDLTWPDANSLEFHSHRVAGWISSLHNIVENSCSYGRLIWASQCWISSHGICRRPACMMEDEFTWFYAVAVRTTASSRTEWRRWTIIKNQIQSSRRKSTPVWTVGFSQVGSGICQLHAWTAELVIGKRCSGLTCIMSPNVGCVLTGYFLSCMHVYSHIYIWTATIKIHSDSARSV